MSFLMKLVSTAVNDVTTWLWALQKYRPCRISILKTIQLSKWHFPRWINAVDFKYDILTDRSKPEVPVFTSDSTKLSLDSSLYMFKEPFSSVDYGFDILDTWLWPEVDFLSSGLPMLYFDRISFKTHFWNNSLILASDLGKKSCQDMRIDTGVINNSNK